MKMKRTKGIGRLFALLATLAAVLMLSTAVMAAPTPMIYDNDAANKKLTLCAVTTNSSNLVEYQIRKFATGKLIDDSIMGYTATANGVKYQISDPIGIAYNTVYKYRVRGVNISTGKTSAWSAYKFYIPKLTINGQTSTAYSGQIKLGIKNVAGVKQYRIYTSLNEDTGYSLSKTVNTTSANSITTYVNAVSGRTNYVMIKAVLTNGKVAEVGNYVYGSVY